MASAAAKKAKEENKKRIKDRLTKTGHKGSITDRWQGVVNEFRDITKHTGKKDDKVTKEQRKVSKIANLDKYDNVKSVLGKSLPLQVQHGPPRGARLLRDMQGGETASEESTHSWTALTPITANEHQCWWRA